MFETFLVDVELDKDVQRAYNLYSNSRGNSVGFSSTFGTLQTSLSRTKYSVSPSLYLTSDFRLRHDSNLQRQGKHSVQQAKQNATIFEPVRVFYDASTTN